MLKNLIPTALFVLVTVAAACDQSKDPPACGSVQDGGITACDGPVEQRCGDPAGARACAGDSTCYCPEHRCVVKNPIDCPDSLFAYAADGLCLASPFSQSALDVAGPGADGVCVEDRRLEPACGVSATAKACGDGQTCSCREHQCVGFDETSICPGGWTYPQLGRCVLAPAPAAKGCVSGFHYPLHGTCTALPPEDEVPGSLVARGQTVCGGQPERPQPCGTVASETCATGFCACGRDPHCVVPVSARRCPSRLANLDDNRCYTDATASERSYIQVDRDDQICEEFKPPSAECGGFAPDEVSGRCAVGSLCSCHEKRCLARTSTTACVSGFSFAGSGRCVERKNAGCPSGFAWAQDGVCIADPIRQTIEASIVGAAQRCPAAPHRSCGVLSASGAVLKCADDTEICSCRGHNRCARNAANPECASRLEWADDGTCVTDVSQAQLSVAQPVRGLCPEGHVVQPECGAVGQSCGNGRCLCRERRCAIATPASVCPSGAMWTTTNRCVGKSVAVTTCASGLTWESDGTCVTPPVPATLGAELLAADQTVCPGFGFPSDAGGEP